MAYFHDLVGAAQDEAELLDAALNTAKSALSSNVRAWANFDGRKPAYQYTGKKARVLTFTFRQGRLKTRGRLEHIKETAGVISAATKCDINTLSQTSLEQTIMELVFIRHGQSEWNAKKPFHRLARRQAERARFGRSRSSR